MIAIVLTCTLMHGVAALPTPWPYLLVQQQTQQAQQAPIIGQNPETAQKGEGDTGWVQAPTIRGLNQNRSDAGMGTATGETTHPSPGQFDANQKAGRVNENRQPQQLPPGQNPQTPVRSALPGPSGTAPGEPR